MTLKAFKINYVTVLWCLLIFGCIIMFDFDTLFLLQWFWIQTSGTILHMFIQEKSASALVQNMIKTKLFLLYHMSFYCARWLLHVTRPIFSPDIICFNITWLSYRLTSGESSGVICRPLSMSTITTRNNYDTKFIFSANV